MVNLEMLYDAQSKLKDISRVTPLISASSLGKNVYIKSENLQFTGAFKIRGAYYKISSLDKNEVNGVIACSAGNHAQGVALSASQMGIKSTICIPAGAPISKIEATKGFGGEVVLVDGVYDDAYEKAMELQKERGLTFIHPFNDEKVIAGQGTIGLEILSQLPEVDAVIVPIGGGGLISGISCAIKSLKPECKVYGVQAEGAPSMYNSVKNKKITGLSEISTIADGIAVKKPGEITFDMVNKYVDEIVTVNDEEIATAILALMEGQKTVAEPAGATTVAAVIFDKLDIKDKNVVCVISGGNIDVNTLSRVITKGLIKTGRITEFTTKVLDKPGQLLNLIRIISDSGVNVFNIFHEREDKESDITSCIVKMVVETRNEEHRRELFDILKSNGYKLF